MRVDRADQLLNRALEAERKCGLGDEFGRPRANHMDAEDLVVLLFGDDLHEAFGFVRDAGAAEGAELEGADPDVEPARLSFSFRQPDAADFRVAVRAGWNLVVVN